MGVAPLAVTGRAMWFLTRGSGAVTLVLLTASVVLGIVNTMRWGSRPRWPRFVLDALHRNVSLLVLAVLAVHVLTAVLDSFAPIRLVDAVVPFVSRYRPLWVGFGALALDLLAAVAITSVLRHRIGFRGWRAVHWLAYACWPIALVHGLGAGTDARLGWMVALSVACVAAVIAALIWRMPREPAIATTSAGVIALVAWAAQGPLASGWAQRAGTPRALLASSISRPAPPTRFSARLAGTARQASAGTVNIAADLSGGARGTLAVVITGTPLDGGGVSMTASKVTLRLPGGVTYRGRITALEGTSLQALVSS
ncbi:MAG: hypothetical protein ACJ77M_07865, partial [Thermoleophilaceae bacterium]